MTEWARARDAFREGMMEVSESFRAPLFQKAVLLLRRSDGTTIETEQADDIQRLLDSQDARNSEAYLAVATRVHDRFQRDM